MSEIIAVARRTRTLTRRLVLGALPLALASLAGSAFAAPLYSNGSFITNPTGGTGTIAGLPISTSDPYTVPGSSFTFATTGVAATVLTNTAAADDFTVPVGGWDLDSLTVYAFQTSQSAATITQVHVNLWTATPYNEFSPDGSPDPLPQPVLAANLVLDAGEGVFVAHRQGATGSSTNRPVFAYTVSLDGLPDAGQLAEGTYWIQWSFLGATSPSQNVFTPLISPRNSVTGHNARLLNSVTGSAADPRAWFEGREGYVAGVTEGRAYELPFELGGTPGINTCSPCPADFDFNGGVDGADLGAFFIDFEQGLPCADVDQNGGLDGGDIAAFFIAFEAGGC